MFFFVTHCSGADDDVKVKEVGENSMKAVFISNELEE
jgi:hypothetical protein